MIVCQIRAASDAETFTPGRLECQIPLGWNSMRWAMYFASVIEKRIRAVDGVEARVSSPVMDGEQCNIQVVATSTGWVRIVVETMARQLQENNCLGSQRSRRPFGLDEPMVA